MGKRAFIIIFLILNFTFVTFASSFGFFGKSYLVIINGQKFTKDDFLKWWENYKEKDTPPPKTLDPFINWILLVQEAERMMLYNTPTYIKKVNTFLKVRALMKLREEEVLKKMDLSDKRLWKYYLKEYTPLLYVRIIIVKDKKKAEGIMKKLREGEDFSKLAKAESEAGHKKKGGELGWTRARDFPSPLREILNKMKEKEIKGPIEYNKRYYIIQVVEKGRGNKEDFEKLKKRLKEELFKKEEAKLTLKLIEKLKKKYKVWINEELLKKLNPINPNVNLEKPLVKMKGNIIKVKDFIKLVKREIAFRKKYHFKEEPIEKTKERVFNNMISQTLTMMEALNRHYEKEEPLKSIFKFYCQRRLIKELENNYIWPKVKVKEEEIEEYYKTHIKEFTKSGLVELASVCTWDEKLANKIYSEIQKGKDFFKVVAKYTYHGVEVNKLPLDHFSKEAQIQIKKLSEGEVSRPFKIGNYVYIIKLLRRGVDQVKPLKEVKSEIREKLRKEKFEKLKREYLKKLRSVSEIKINEKLWRKIKNKLEKEYHEKKA